MWALVFSIASCQINSDFVTGYFWVAPVNPDPILAGWFRSPGTIYVITSIVGDPTRAGEKD